MGSGEVRKYVCGTCNDETFIFEDPHFTRWEVTCGCGTKMSPSNMYEESHLTKEQKEWMRDV